METLSNVQKEFLKFLCGYKRDSLSKQMSEVIFDFFELKNEKIKIMILESKIEFFSEDKNINTESLNHYKNQIIQILILLRRLSKQECLIYYERKKINQNNIGDDLFLFEINYDLKNLLGELGSQYSVSPLIEKYIANNFKTDAQIEKMELIKNDKFTRLMSIAMMILTTVSIFVGIYFNNKTIDSSYDIANNISTTVVFKNDEQFKKLTSPKQVNVKNENNIIIPETFYKQKIELKLEIFK